MTEKKPELQPPQPENAREGHEARYFIECYEGAKKVGMERNFVEYFIRDYKETHDVYAACWFAYCEWDL